MRLLKIIGTLDYARIDMPELKLNAIYIVLLKSHNDPIQ